MAKFFFAILVFTAFHPAVYAQEIITPEGRLQEPDWTQKEREAGFSKRLIKNAPGSSSFWIRLKTSEIPHKHLTHDIAVTVIRGKALVHLGQKAEQAGEGDIIEIPRGTVHWVENRGPEPCLAYAVFTPVLDGQDYQPAE